MFPKKSKEGKDFEHPDSKPGDGTSTAEVSQNATDVKMTNSDDGSSSANQKSLMRTSSNSNVATDTDNSGSDKPPSFWDKHKKWIKPTAIGLTGLGLVYIGVKMMHKPMTAIPKPTPPLTGVKSRKKKKKGGHQDKKKQAIAYL